MPTIVADSDLGIIGRAAGAWVSTVSVLTTVYTYIKTKEFSYRQCIKPPFASQ